MAATASNSPTRLNSQDRLKSLERSRAMALGMDFAFLLDPERKLLSIGYSLADNTLDPNCYDLLASEARLASLFAIAKGDVTTRHWFRLGRSADAGRRRLGADFLVGIDVRIPDAVACHARAGRQPARTDEPSRGGAAERHTVQRSAFRGAFRSRRITPAISNSPTSTRISACRVSASSAVCRRSRDRAIRDRTGRDGRSAAARENYRQLAAMGALGRYGFYKALDFTRSRLPGDETLRSSAISWRIIRA